MKTKLLLIPLIALLVIGATVQNLTKDNIADAPASVTIAGTNLFLVLSNRTLVRVSLSNVFNALSTQSSLNVGFSNITSSGTISAGVVTATNGLTGGGLTITTNGTFGGSVNATNGFKKGAFTGITTTNTFYSVSSDLMTTVTNVVVLQGGIVTAWTVTP